MFYIGDIVSYAGRQHRLVGLTPMSVAPAQVELEDVVTRQRVWIELAALRAAPREHEHEPRVGAAAPASPSSRRA